MQKTRTLLAIVAAGMIPLAAGRADARDAFAVGNHAGGQTCAVPLTPLWNNQAITPLTGRAGTGRYFKIAVPRGQTYLNVLTAGGRGDSDLYLAYGRLPTPKDYQYASNGGGTEEQVSILYPKAGTWYVLVHSFSGYRDVSLLGSSWQQQVYYDRDDHNRYDSTCGDCVNTQVRIVWGDHGNKGPLGGLISFIVGRLQNRGAVRHSAIGDRRHEHAARRPAPPRPNVTARVVRPARRETVRRIVAPRRPAPVVRQRAVQPAPKVVLRPAVTLVRKVARKLLSTPIRTQVRKTTVSRTARPQPRTSARTATARTTTTRTRRQPVPSTNRNQRRRDRR